MPPRICLDWRLPPVSRICSQKSRWLNRQRKRPWALFFFFAFPLYESRMERKWYYSDEKTFCYYGKTYPDQRNFCMRKFYISRTQVENTSTIPPGAVLTSLKTDKEGKASWMESRYETSVRSVLFALSLFARSSSLAILQVQSGAAGFNTGNGETLSSNQAACLVSCAWLPLSFSEGFFHKISF